MRALALKTVIYKYDRFEDFAKEFALGEGDLLFTNEFLYEPFMKHLDLKCDIIFQERFGTSEPTDKMVDAILEAKGGKKYKRIIAVGGGSVLDIGKILAAKRPKSVLDFYETPPVKETELIIIPTTCGTGSEVTNIAMLYVTDKKSKIGIVNDELLADTAVLIPELVKTLPYQPFIYSVIDALIHAVESYASRKATDYTQMFGEKAIKVLLRSLMQVAEKGPDYRYQILENFLIGSNFAGIAFGTGGCSAVHAMSFPLGGYYHVAHGESNYALFTAVFKEFCRKAPDNESLNELNALLARVLRTDAKGEAVYDVLEDTLSSLIKRKALSEYGVTEDRIPDMADLVIEKQQRLLVNNCVPFDRDTIIRIYRELL